MNYNFDNERPIYIQLVEMLKIDIISGKLKTGEKLPSVRDFAASVRVNPNTMQKALAELEKEKLIYTERTNGKYVTIDEKLIKKIKDIFAKNLTNNYKNDMYNIGIKEKEIIKYLNEGNEENGIN